MLPAARLDTLLQDGTDGDDVFTVTAEELFEATFDGLGGTDTVELIGGGNFDLSSAVLSALKPSAARPRTIPSFSTPRLLPD
jgi:hypothetical protein